MIKYGLWCIILCMGVLDVAAAGVFVELGYNALHNHQPPLIHLTIHRRLCTTSPPPIYGVILSLYTGVCHL